MGPLPIINEKASISTAEIEIGDNDTLGAIVATAINADLLINLSDIDGLYTSDPRKNEGASLIHTVDNIDEKIEAMIGGVGSSLGTGGMATKIKAAKLVTRQGIDMVIANGNDPTNLYDIVKGKNVGTRFMGVK